MKINRKELAEAVQLLLPGTDQGTYIQGCDTIVFTDTTISSYNDRIAISVPFKSELSGAVKAQEFFKILNKLSTDELDIIVKDNIWQIISGSTELEIVLKDQAISDYINNLNIPIDQYKTLPETFTEGIKLCYIPGNSFYLRGILFTDNLVMSTDNNRMNFYTMDSKIDDIIWIDDAVVSNLIKMNKIMTGYALTESWIHFKSESSMIFSAIRKQESSYPYKKLMEYFEKYQKKSDDLQNILPNEFNKIMDRVGILSNEADGFYLVNLDISTDTLFISASNDIGKIKDKIKWSEPFTEDVSVKFISDFNFLKEAYSKCPIFYIRKNNDVDMDIVFSTDNFKQIVRGMSL